VQLGYTSIGALWHPDAGEHRRRAAEIGVHCSEDVFQQLFHAPRLDPLLLVAVAAIDWAGVRWREADLSGLVLSQVALPRGYAAAVDAARRRVIDADLSDEPPEVATQWEMARTWLRAPILATGELCGAAVSYRLLVGRARLGTLIGMIESGRVPPEQRHRVWLAERLLAG
jgi:hypothetical protein